VWPSIVLLLALIRFVRHQALLFAKKVWLWQQEGGLRAWLTVVSSSSIHFASFGIVNSFGYFQDFYQADYPSNYSSSAIAFIALSSPQTLSS